MAANFVDVLTRDGRMQHLTKVMEEGKDALARFTVTDASSMPPIDCEIAVHVDAVTPYEVQEEMSADTHIMVAGVLRTLAKIHDASYEKVEAAISNASLCEPNGNNVIKSDKYIKTGDKSKFLVDGKPSRTLVKDITSWMTRVISDKKVMTELKMDMAMLARIITASSLSIDWLARLTGETQYRERKIMELGVLRFPDENNAFFQLYKIDILAFLDVSRENFDMVDKNGIVLKYESKQFVPRESIIDKLNPDTKKQAEGESVKFFTSKPKMNISVGAPRFESAMMISTVMPKWPKVQIEGGVTVPPVVTVLKNAQGQLNSFTVDSTTTPVNCKLAVAFDDLKRSSISKMSDYTLMLVYAANKSLAKISEAALSFDSVKSALSDISVVEIVGTNINADTISKTYENKKFIEPNEQVQSQVKNWIKRLINDHEIMEDLQGLLDAGVLTKCMVTAGEHIDVLEKIQGSHKYQSSDIVDLAVLRYPDDTREYFHLYNIKLSAFTDCTRDMIDEKDKCGLKGDVQWIKFGPREAVFKKLSGSTVERVSALGLEYLVG